MGEGNNNNVRSVGGEIVKHLLHSFKIYSIKINRVFMYYIESDICSCCSLSKSMMLSLPIAIHNINNHNQVYKIMRNIEFTCIHILT